MAYGGAAAAPNSPIDRSSLTARLQELGALVPELRVPEGEPDLFEVGHILLDLLERKQRQLIEENVRLAGLRELTETLLREPDEEKILRTISLYLRHAYGLPDVAVLTRDPEGGLRGYRSRGIGRNLCEAIGWSRESIRGSVWERALAGATIVSPEGLEGPQGTPAPLPLILPLLSAASEADGRSESAGAVMGLLALRPDGDRVSGADPLEVGQIAFQAATLLESVRQHRRAAQEMRFRECLLEAMGDGMIAVDALGRVTALNRAASELLQVDRSILGSDFSLLAERAPELIQLCVEGLKRLEKTPPREAAIHLPAGKIPVTLQLVPLADGAEVAGGLVVTISDLRPLRAMEEEIRRLDRLAALGRFASAVAHEIRNPLAAIGTGIEYISGSIAPERAEEVRILRSEVQRLDRIVRDLLEPARARPLEPSKIQVAHFVQRACRAVEPQAREHQVLFSIRPPAEEQVRAATVTMDVERMLQVLVNLIRNAVEASPKGAPVEIGWSGAPAGSPGEVRIWVRDEGPGIPQDQLPHIFEPFFSTKSGGTGLGLYVSHSIVRQHEGTLAAEASPGGGTIMTIRIPPVLG